MPARNWYVVIAVLVAVLILAYALGWFGGGDAGPAATTTTPPAAGTTGTGATR
jgi:Flp pilus assembly protein protease CpaA